MLIVVAPFSVCVVVMPCTVLVPADELMIIVMRPVSVVASANDCVTELAVTLRMPSVLVSEPLVAVVR